MYSVARRDVEFESDVQHLSDKIEEARRILKKVELRAEDLEAAIRALREAKEVSQKKRGQ